MRPVVAYYLCSICGRETISHKTIKGSLVPLCDRCYRSLMELGFIYGEERNRVPRDIQN